MIAIMAVLAGLITAAAVNAMRASRRSSITLDIKNISGAIENLKNDYGAYPPNGMNPDPLPNPPSGSEAALVLADFQRMFKKAFPRHQEPPALIAALCGQNLGGPVGENLVNGMTSAEALVFWLGGFSDDPQYPISGPGGPSYADPAGGSLEPTDEVLENRNWRYEFDLTKLGSRDEDNGAFTGRSITYQVNTGAGPQVRGINFWRYSPGSSEQPLLYFDTSRYKPHQYDVWAADPMGTPPAPYVFALKQLRSGAAGIPATAADYQNNVVFVEQGKFQVLHCGLDDAWGNEFQQMSLEESTGMGWGYAKLGGAEQQLLLYPEGPFIGEIGDTLTSFTDGTLADETEE